MKILSRKDIEKIAERVLKAYKNLPENINTDITHIDPELLLTNLLGFNLEYTHLSLDGSILGATTTVPMEIEVYAGDDSQYTYLLDGKTVLIEQDLKEDIEQLGRCNFTIAHESAHQILKMLYPKDYDSTPQSAKVHFYKTGSEKQKQITDWYEWQANALASAILLPADLIKRAMYIFTVGEKITMLNKIYALQTYDKFCNMARFLVVSKTALAIRMKQLGLLENNYLDEPYSLVDVYYTGG